ncbi:MAG: hypothetical protein GY810_14980 [Aureispira sp.]|nr:hypothetical protein [Aureispira sp.]
MYGLVSEFWFDDEFQIYLIGLKSFTTGTWPYYGPDIVYTQTQISGALQGLLISSAFYIIKIPEAPILLLNLLSFGSLSFLAYYITKRVDTIPSWLTWIIVLTTPWAMVYSTRVLNISYALVFSVFFFVAFFEALPLYKQAILSKKTSFFLMGLTTTFIMQLHLSWVLLIVFGGIAFTVQLKTKRSQLVIFTVLYLSGILLGALTIIPTWLYTTTPVETLDSNIVFNHSNWLNLPIILLRLLSFATNEIPYILGTPSNRIDIVTSQLWFIPVTITLLIIGFLQVGLLVISFFRNKSDKEWRYLKWFPVASAVLLYGMFFFSIKGPSSHTFYILFPPIMLYSFYCYQWLIEKKPFALSILKIMAILGLFFHVGLGMYNYEHKSLYKDRQKIQQALDKMDYHILGRRRADDWGYGY